MTGAISVESAVFAAVLILSAAVQADDLAAVEEPQCGASCAADDFDQLSSLQLAKAGRLDVKRMPRCSGDLVYTECGTACESICGQPKPGFCTQQCVQGCQCPRGHWRAGEKCYESEEACPATPSCPGDLEFMECGTACESICGQPKPGFCTKQCVQGCQCPRGHWRAGEKCYESEAACPALPSCPGDLEFMECGTACESICGQPKPDFCTSQCVQGCQCPHGHWRAGERCYESQGACPSSSSCPGELEYTKCGTACEKICGKPKPGPCSKQCVEGCQCPRGQWRAGDKCYRKKRRCPGN